MINGYTALNNEDYEAAVDHLSAWGQLVPENPWPHCALGDVHISTSAYEQAQEAYQRCFELAGDDPDAQTTAQSNLAHVAALVAISDDDLDSALDYFTQAIEFKPEDGSLFCERGIVYADLGEPEDARQDYESCLDLIVDDPDGRTWAEELLQSLDQ